ncbi:hypothetical protein [Collinsella sp. i05-0019-G5]|uniref:hypothetical protein n=1 Tax=Collinsella sp. i05-0019-G5 TaxID=3132705 RepID=UPI0036F3492B
MTSISSSETTACHTNAFSSVASSSAVPHCRKSAKRSGSILSSVMASRSYLARACCSSSSAMRSFTPGAITPCSMALRMFLRPLSAALSESSACLRRARTSAVSARSATMLAICSASPRSPSSPRSAEAMEPSSSSRLMLRTHDPGQL